MYKQKFQCGRTLLNENWVVTGAHCIHPEDINQLMFFGSSYKAPSYYDVRKWNKYWHYFYAFSSILKDKSSCFIQSHRSSIIRSRFVHPQWYCYDKTARAHPTARKYWVALHKHMHKPDHTHAQTYTHTHTHTPHHTTPSKPQLITSHQKCFAYFFQLCNVATGQWLFASWSRNHCSRQWLWFQRPLRS